MIALTMLLSTTLALFSLARVTDLDNSLMTKDQVIEDMKTSGAIELQPYRWLPIDGFSVGRQGRWLICSGADGHTTYSLEVTQEMFKEKPVIAFYCGDRGIEFEDKY